MDPIIDCLEQYLQPFELWELIYIARDLGNRYENTYKFTSLDKLLDYVSIHIRKCEYNAVERDDRKPRLNEVPSLSSIRKKLSEFSASSRSGYPFTYVLKNNYHVSITVRFRKITDPIARDDLQFEDDE